MVRLFQILGTSVFLQLLLLMVVVDSLRASCVTPALLAMEPRLVLNNEYWHKITDYFTGAADPDVVLMGSSLMLSPAVRCDLSLLGPNDPARAMIHTEQTAAYSKAKYLEKLLKENCGKDLSIYNLGFPNVMACENYHLLKEMVDSKKHPSFIILGVAPRDFVNAKRMKPDETTFVKKLLDFNKEKNANFLERLASVPALVSKHVEEIQEDVGLVKFVATSKVDDWKKNGFQAATKDGAAKSDGELPTKEAIAVDNAMYTEYFTGATEELVGKQLAYLGRMLKLARDSHIPVVVVNLPVTSAHTNMLSSSIVQAYEDGVRKEAQTHGCAFIDLAGLDQYDDNLDFKDTIHLNARGGRKLYAALVDKLPETGCLNRGSIATRRFESQ